MVDIRLIGDHSEVLWWTEFIRAISSGVRNIGPIRPGGTAQIRIYISGVELPAIAKGVR
jgi:hypothetical protein